MIRKGADGKRYSAPDFFEDTLTDGWLHGNLLLNKGKMLAWWKARSHRTLRELQLEVIEWMISREEERGFRSESDRERYLAPLKAKLRTLRSSRQDGPT